MSFSTSPVPQLSPQRVLLRWLLGLIGCAVLALLPKSALARVAGDAARASSTSPSDQNGKGSITGHVSDTGGGILHGAAVSVQPGGLSTASDAQGQFTISNLPSGDYTITVAYSGFAPFTAPVKVTPDQKASLDVVLRVAAANQSVMVHGDLQGEAEEFRFRKPPITS